jgi:hypothetical protein
MAPQDDGKPPEPPMCSELRCKGMYIPKDVPPEELQIIPGDTTHWWCERTQYSIGPDQDWVHRTVCTPSRACFRRPGDPAV